MKARDDLPGLADHLPPQNLEAERGVIGAALLDSDSLHETAGILTSGDFYRDAHQTVWRALIDLYNGGHAIDAISLADELARRGEYRAVGGDDILMEIANSVPHAANARYHAEIVRQKSVTRQLIQSATEIIRDCYSGLHTADELLDAAESKVMAIGEGEASGSTTPIGEIVHRVVAEIQSRKQGAPTGLQTGFSALDDMLSGFRDGDLIVLAARPSQGKTALAMSISQRVAQSTNGHVLFFSLEMSGGQLGERLLSATSDVDAARMKQTRLLGDDDMRSLVETGISIVGLPIEVDDSPGRSVTQIGATARRIKSRHGLSLVVIDYLGLIDGQRVKGESRQEEVARISRRLKSLARELKTPILCLHQLNRQSETRADRRPMLADLRESGQIEADADAVILLHRPEFYDPKDSEGKAMLFIAKNRNGPTGEVWLQFTKQCTRFDNLAPDFAEEPANGSAY